jgi:hypothetical protein
MHVNINNREEFYDLLFLDVPPCLLVHLFKKAIGGVIIHRKDSFLSDPGSRS